MSQTAIRCDLMRGGTSKGAYFLQEDLPADPALRDRLLLAIMGSPDPRQIDGIGGADPLTSKVAIVSRSQRPGIDVDYLFCQVFVDQPVVSTAQNCGNILAAVGPFAIERGLVAASDPITTVRIYMTNTAQTVWPPCRRSAAGLSTMVARGSTACRAAPRLSASASRTRRDRCADPSCRQAGPWI
jgi:4-oxalomesaconate tautomerase